MFIWTWDSNVQARLLRSSVSHELRRQRRLILNWGINNGSYSFIIYLKKSIVQPEEINQIGRFWRWTPDGRYSAKSAYTMLHAGSTRFHGHQLIWKTSPPLRVKIFMWLALDRGRRRRHGLEARDTCFLWSRARDNRPYHGIHPTLSPGSYGTSLFKR